MAFYQFPEKDPSAVLDFLFDWKALTNGSGDADDGDWLGSGETITDHTITVPTGITVESSSLTDTNTSVTVWLSGGTAYQDYIVACKIVTSAGRTDERSGIVPVRDR